MKTHYKMWKNIKGKWRQFAIAVPTEYGDAFQANGIDFFTCELTEDGLLYRPVFEKSVELENMPSWLKKK